MYPQQAFLDKKYSEHQSRASCEFVDFSHWLSKVGRATVLIRGSKNHPSLFVYPFSLLRHAHSRVSSYSLMVPANIVLFLFAVFFFFIFVCFLISASHCPRPEKSHSFSKIAHNTSSPKNPVWHPVSRPKCPTCTITIPSHVHPHLTEPPQGSPPPPPPQP